MRRSREQPEPGVPIDLASITEDLERLAREERDSAPLGLEERVHGTVVRAMEGPVPNLRFSGERVAPRELQRAIRTWSLAAAAVLVIGISGFVGMIVLKPTGGGVNRATATGGGATAVSAASIAESIPTLGAAAAVDDVSSEIDSILADLTRFDRTLSEGWPTVSSGVDMLGEESL
ncbi:MAG: hypothetical protein JNM07_05520 [Phycisphaerae bacterium]|nr:hypothetical protein [Phycisphaerae bacterium]